VERNARAEQERGIGSPQHSGLPAWIVAPATVVVVRHKVSGPEGARRGSRPQRRRICHLASGSASSCDRLPPTRARGSERGWDRAEPAARFSVAASDVGEDTATLLAAQCPGPRLDAPCKRAVRAVPRRPPRRALIRRRRSPRAQRALKRDDSPWRPDGDASREIH
jgi:hypothetical protein